MDTDNDQVANSETSTTSDADANNASSSASQSNAESNGDKNEGDKPTLRSVIMDSLNADGEGNGEEGGEPGSDSPTDKHQDPTKPGSPEGKDANKDGNDPFHKHPRFKELTSENKELKAYREDTAPLIEKARTYGLSRQDHEQAIDIAGKIQGALNGTLDPDEAFLALSPILQGLQQIAGMILPEDLAKDVKDGKISRERAEELARMRHKAKSQETTLAKTKEEREKESLESFVADCKDAAAVWLDTQAKADPDFGRKQQTILDLVKLSNLQKPPRSVEDAIQRFEDAKAEVEKRFAGTSSPSGIKPPLRGGARPVTSGRPKSMREAIMMGLEAPVRR